MYKMLKSNWAIQVGSKTVCPKAGEIVEEPVGVKGLLEKGVLEKFHAPEKEEPKPEPEKPKRGRPKKQPEAE